MNQVLLLLVAAAALLALGWLMVAALAEVVSPHVAGPRLRAIFAKVVCPRTGASLRVRLGVATENGDAVPQILSCERFGSASLTCDRSCLQRTETTIQLHSSAAPA